MTKASDGTARVPEVRIFKLGSEPHDDLRDVTTVEQRLEILRELSERAWELGGQPWPSYERSAIPVHVIRPR